MAFCEKFLQEGSNNISVTPGGRVESVARTSLSIDEEFLEIPSDVIFADDIVHELVSFSNAVNRLGTRFLKRQKLYPCMPKTAKVPSRIRKEDDCFRR